MKAYKKTVFRMLKSNIARLLAIVAIVGLGIGFITGLGAVAPNLKASADRYYADRAAPDLVVKSASPLGLTDGQRSILSAHESVADSLAFTVFDTEADGETARAYFLPLRSLTVNTIEVTEGRFPEKADEILVERESIRLKKRSIGDAVPFNGQTLTIVGIAANPLLLSKEGEPSMVESGPDADGGKNKYKDLTLILYFDTACTPAVAIGADGLPVPLPVTDMYIRLAGAETLKVFSKKYRDFADEKIRLLKNALETENGRTDTAAGGDPVFLTLRENKSAAILETNADKVTIISLFFPVFFVGIAALVVLTTMTRLAEEERPLIGCYKTLGYGKGKILWKYLCFALIGCLAGCPIGIAAGDLILAPVILGGFVGLLHPLPHAVGFDLTFGLSASGVMIAVVLLVTAHAVLSMLREKPAALLKHKAPKAGKKIFLERIPLLWKRLKFKYKSTLRNIFRYVRHFIMAVVTMAGSTALVLSGLALRNAVGAGTYGDMAGMADSMSLISTVIVVCAALLAVLVVHNLTDVNIAERKREIATLKVLGYKAPEVAGFIFREIMILSFIGCLFGLPLGCLFIYFVFTFVEFGALADIQWYAWVLAAVVPVFLTLIVDATLYRKIVKTDMLGSLKTVE
ncbi:hypothetical protein FACS1894211_11520 [Clostridia bacterium]|nr:hypothetical protein FACS1894211_11520 [Clostridia bacterium]